MKPSLHIRSLKLLPAVIAAVALLGIFYGNVNAQQPIPSDDEVNAIAKQLFCPVCENVPLDVCPTQACAQWRDVIREKLTLGWTEDQIKDYFVNQYGDRVLSTPPLRGFNWLVYVLPPLFILIGIFILVQIFLAIIKFSAIPEEPLDPSAINQPEDDPYISQMEEELSRRIKSK
ncbi:MAG: cytochrome c-type biogenesis protein CcmH [Anaerolineaceae bacterium]